MNHQASLQLTASGSNYSIRQKIGLALIGVGTLTLFVTFLGEGTISPVITLGISLAGFLLGSGILFSRLFHQPPGVNNNGVWFSGVTARGMMGWILGIVLTGFYIILYWAPSNFEQLVRSTDSLSMLIRGEPSNQWFLYGFFYTLAVLVMGARMLIKYRDNRYQILRTISVMFFQLGFAFLIPQLLVLLNQPEFYFSYFWPLKYDYLWPSTFSSLSGPGLGIFLLFWTSVMTVIATPILTYFYGKRWYCSWVCGCGGLAETAGDPFRHLSDKSVKAWKIERWMVHSVLVFVIVTTLMLWGNQWLGGGLLGGMSQVFSQWYGFFIGLIFAGVIGVGFYPIMGSRVWCRFGCPMAAVLGLLQKYFSRFRITTNGGQCISCGNCSTYCEMGIDVRWYAQRGQNIIRASCVGCGMCAAVCPRGVLRLENAPIKARYNGPILIHHDDVSVQLNDTWRESRPLMPSVQEDLPILTDKDL
ncbi:MAG: 4Fe-4S binding protein [Bacteroidetes bacterium]|nr:4Fe-4S binding protein [Bacteroidota bacterium]MCY4204600.1 4Fe-4S binding protein [Bacteroidota bacterium]